MLALKTILHPTDFSASSEYSFRLACSLARDYGARLILLHVAPEPVLVYGEGIVPPDPSTHLGELREKLRRLPVPDPAIHVDRQFEQGDPATMIVSVAEEQQPDLIVMGTHGRTGLSRLLMGSVAEEVLRKAPCPVLTVKTPSPEKAHADLPAEELVAAR